ncbi:STM4014 family protein [Bremerella cremea]|uniref:STM4014 family protein n=1 Tax=Bremerella cremea TaxID=1031537 RepID=UPI0031ECDE4E
MSRNEPRRWNILGNPDCRRVARFQAALNQRGQLSAQLIDYASVLGGDSSLTESLASGTLLRIESAAESFSTRRMLLAYGYDRAMAEGYQAASPQQIERHTSAASIEFKPRQLYLGFQRLLQEVDEVCAASGCLPVQAPTDIACMYDKWHCQQLLAAAGIAVPKLLGRIQSWDHLRELTGNDGRTMVKMAHGSGGVGCIALHWSHGRVRAFMSSQTLAMAAPELADLSVPIQVLSDERSLAYVIEQLVPEQIHLEHWLAKAKHQGNPFDLRVVVIAGRPRHAIARVGRSPFTNLNLGGQRLGLDQLDGSERVNLWSQVESMAAKVANCFPQTLSFGLDLLLTPTGQLNVLEVNAFGDLLLNVLSEGQDPYAAEIAATEAWIPSRSGDLSTTGIAVA